MALPAKNIVAWGKAVSAAVALGLGLAGCSTGGTSASSAASATAKSAPCPETTAPAGPRAGGKAPAAVPYAKTVKATDTSTSTVISPTGPQIQCGKTQVTTYSDVVYSTPTTQLKMDIQVPKTSGTKPLVVYITGGGFVMSDRTANLSQRTYLAEQGYTVASIQYRTILNGATYREVVGDVKSAIRYLRAHAGQYEINGSKVAVWGQSAGGYLAAMTGATNGVKKFDVGDNLSQSSDVQAVVDEFGASNLSTLAADFDAATQKGYYAPGNFLAQWVYGPGTKKSIANYTSEVAAANPDTYLTSSSPAFMLLQGSQDHIISPSQSLDLLNALKSRGVEATRYVLQGANHGDLSFMGDAKAGQPWSTQEVMGDISAFLRKHLGN